MQGGWTKLFRGAKRMQWIVLAAAVAVAALIWASTARQTGQAPGATQLEARVAQVLSLVDNAGQVQVLIGEGEDAGVLVVAQGADDIGVAIKLAQAVKTLLGVDYSRIEVLKMQQGG